MPLEHHVAGCIASIGRATTRLTPPSSTRRPSQCETWNRLTSDDKPVLPSTWTQDGEYVAFRSGNALAWKRSDGSGNVEYLAASAPMRVRRHFPLTESGWRSGRWQILLQEAGSKGAPRISPDGRWLAYGSNESGRLQIYVVPFSSQARGVGRKV